MNRSKLPLEARKESFLNEIKRIQFEYSLELGSEYGKFNNFFLYDSFGWDDEVLLESVREMITELEDAEVN